VDCTAANRLTILCSGWNVDQASDRDSCKLTATTITGKSGAFGSEMCRRRIFARKGRQSGHTDGRACRARR